MKNLIFFLFVFLGGVSAGEALPATGMRVSLPPESISISTGEIRKFEVPFPIEQYKSSTGNVRINNVNGRTFELEGVSPGDSLITISAQSMNKNFHVAVSSAVMPVYRELSRELSVLSEVTIEFSDNILALRGEITRIEHWEYFRRVIRRYEKNCRNYVVFRPGPALFEELKKIFAAAGYKVVDKTSPDCPGQLSFQISNGVLTVSGYLLCESDIVAVKQILASQKWLSPEWNGNVLHAETALSIADTQLDVGIVFVGVTRTQLERLGNSSADGTVLSWNLIAWFRALAGGAPEGIANASRGKGLYSMFNTTLKGSLLFFGSNGISDFRDAGHLTITNNSRNYATYENGGTLNVKIYGQDVAELKPIDFGLKLKARGGLVRANMVRLELELEKSLAPVKQEEDYFQRSTKTKIEILCPLDKTAVIAGQKELSYSNSGPNGYAFLRHIPVVNWFMASEEKQGEEMQMLILVCPQLTNQLPQMTETPSSETAGVEKQVSDSVRDKSRKVREREKSNWFLKMFTW